MDYAKSHGSDIFATSLVTFDNIQAPITSST